MCNARTCVVGLDGVCIASAIRIGLWREVWQGSRRATDILTDFDGMAEVRFRVVLRELSL